MIRVSFGRSERWAKVVPRKLDDTQYSIEFVDFRHADLAAADCVVPLQLLDYGNLRKFQSQHAKKFLIPSTDVVSLCNDKLLLNETLSGSSFRRMVPRLLAAGDRQFPYVLKKRIGSGGRGTYIFKDRDAEARHLPEFDEKSFFRQTYIPGEKEYATHMLLVQRRVLYCSTNEYTMAGELLARGPVWPCHTALNVVIGANVMDLLTALMLALNYNGTCCLNYKIFEGEVMLLEINPRCGATLKQDIRAYLNAYSTAVREQA